MATIRTTITTCDKCGKILENKTDARHWRLSKRIFSLRYEDSSDWREKDYWTLCYDCTQELKKMVKVN